MKQKADHQKANEISESELIHHVRLSVNPRFQDWVLFKNGTYIIFEDADAISNIEIEAIEVMKKFGPVYTETSSADFDVTDLNKTEGWIVSGHAYGMYTYVSPNEIDFSTLNSTAIGLYGRSKRDLDGTNPIIIHINRKKSDK
ncbi:MULTISPECIES: hypothetical protein [Flavobacterium]|uniref:hypothetical protein n=1 Tax=Flavobacterium TaxID=237 RepID=UPI0011841369|nr:MULTISPECIES: hypothetical protein [Flavobacterium]MCR4031522.1 hypothetical protein [Flavobacterium panacis]